MADAKTSQVKANEPAQTVEQTTQPTKLYFVPEYGVSVQAASLEEAIAKAKKAKGSK